MLRGGKRILAAVVLALVPVLAFSGTVQAATTYVDGANTLTDDWGDHFDELGNSLCDGCADSNNTDLVLMWQAVLYSENYLNAADLDGYFGPRTDGATESWQSDAGGLQVDGWVGDQTWGRADGRLGWYTVNSDPPIHYVRYNAASGSGYVLFFRGSSSTRGDGDYRLLRANDGSNTVTFSGSSRIQYYSRTITKN
jgi:hypothetical protein